MGSLATTTAMRFFGLALLVAFASGVGCATFAPCPAKGGPSWAAYTSEHFELLTDVEPSLAQNVVHTLENTRAAVLGLMWGGQEGPPERTRLIFLDTETTMKRLAGSRIAGVYMRAPPLPNTMIFAADSHGGMDILTHEMGHDLSRWFLPLQPAWYAEGMASFLSTIRYDPKEGRASAGEVSQREINALRVFGLLNVEFLMDSFSPERYENLSFESTSWLLVHYLINHHGQAFARFQKRLIEMEPARLAWRTEFPDLDPSTLDFRLKQYAHATSFTVTSRPMTAWQGDVRVRALSDAEVHGVRAYLYFTVDHMDREGHPAEARAELDEATRDAVPPIEALVVAFYHRDAKDAAARAALAKRATDTHPESWLAWCMSADSTEPSSPAHQAAIDRALELEPDSREVLVRAALAKAHQQRWDEAVVFSTRALRAGILRTDLFTVHLTGLAKTGYCAEAEQWTAMAGGALPLRESEGLSRLWGTLKPACVPAPPRTKAAPAAALSPHPS